MDATVQELATKLEMIAEKEAAILELKTEFEARTAEKVAEEDAFNLENKEQWNYRIFCSWLFNQRACSGGGGGV